SARQPRVAPAPRSASIRSCSTISLPSLLVDRTTGDSAPQNGQINACLPGSHLASAPHAGQWNFSRAVATPSSDPLTLLGSFTMAPGPVGGDGESRYDCR